MAEPAGLLDHLNLLRAKRAELAACIDALHAGEKRDFLQMHLAQVEAQLQAIHARTGCADQSPAR